MASLAGAISRWEDQVVTAVITGVANARSESLNRIAKLEARQACGFATPPASAAPVEFEGPEFRACGPAIPPSSG